MDTRTMTNCICCGRSGPWASAFCSRSECQKNREWYRKGSIAAVQPPAPEPPSGTVKQSIVDAVPEGAPPQTAPRHDAVKFLQRLAEKGGAIVSSASASTQEIFHARACGTFFVDEDGFGYILKHEHWRRTAQRENEKRIILPKSPPEQADPAESGQERAREWLHKYWDSIGALTWPQMFTESMLLDYMANFAAQESARDKETIARLREDRNWHYRRYSDAIERVEAAESQVKDLRDILSNVAQFQSKYGRCLSYYLNGRIQAILNRPSDPEVK